MVDIDQESSKFSLPSQGSEKYKEMSGEYGGGDDEGGIVPKLLGFFKKYLIIFIVLLVLILGLAGYLLLRPQYGSASIEISILDSPGEAVAGATITITQSDDGKLVKETFSDEIGLAKINDLPAGKELNVKITPIQQELMSYRTTITLKEKEVSDLTIDLEKRNNLSLDAKEVSYTIAAGCAQKVEIGISNIDTADFETDLIADSKLEKYTKSPGLKAIPAGGSEMFVTTINLPTDAPSDISGSYRLKYTKDKAIKVNIKKSDKKPKLDITFDKTDARDFRATTADLPMVKKTQIKLKNSGSSGAVPVTEIKITIGGEFTNWVQLDTSAADEANVRGGVKPGEEVLIGYTVTIPQGTPEGPYSGQLIVASGCDKKYLPLNVKVEAE